MSIYILSTFPIKQNFIMYYGWIYSTQDRIYTSYTCFILKRKQITYGFSDKSANLITSHLKLSLHLF